MRAALRNAVGERMSLGRRLRFRFSTASTPQRRATSAFAGSVATTSLKPSGDRPSAISIIDIVFAVNWPPHAPAPGQARLSTSCKRASSILPAPCAPTASNTCWIVIDLPSSVPWSMLPPYSATPGTFRRASAIAAAGIVLSQPHSTTIASSEWPSTASSIESVMTSRLTSDARMPGVPIAMPSVTAIVLNSIGVPPAARTPSATSCARSRRFKLHGDTFDHVCTTATSGFAIAAASRPVAYSIARAGARSGPVFITSLRIFVSRMVTFDSNLVDRSFLAVLTTGHGRACTC